MHFYRVFKKYGKMYVFLSIYPTNSENYMLFIGFKKKRVEIHEKHVVLLDFSKNTEK